MTYLERVTNSYRDAMMEKGVSEDVVNYALFAFETGFVAGSLIEKDVALQQEMVNIILEN